MNIFKQIRNLIFLFAIILIIGTTGYMLIEKFSFLDALFMTVITISTVGYGTVKDLSEIGVFFTIFLILTSLLMVAMILENFSRFISDGKLKEKIKIRKTKRQMKNTENHVIVCGYGLNGSHAVLELIKSDEKVVVIDPNEELTNNAILHGVNAIFLNGDARQEEVLFDAKIDKAKALITALHDDSDNLYIALTARELNPGLKIISRGIEDSSERKLLRAGADHVVLPDSVGGIRMAKLISEPEVIEFLENIIAKSGISVNLVEIDCQEMKRSYIGRTISQLDVRRRSGVSIIGLKNNEGEYMFNPSSSTKIDKGTKLFVLGTPKQVDIFKEIVKDN